MKVRVVKGGDRFYPEKRVFLLWRPAGWIYGYNDDEPISFAELERAVEYAEQVRDVAPEPDRVVVWRG